MSAVGWSPRQVGGLVLAEGVAVSVIGAGVGLLLGVLGAGALTDALGVSTAVRPDVTATSMLRGIAIGIAIGVVWWLWVTLIRWSPMTAICIIGFLRGLLGGGRRW